MSVEEQSGILCKIVVRPVFNQEAMNRQEITQDAHAAFGSLAALRNHCGGRVALGDSGEYFQLNGSVYCLGQFISVDGVNEALWSGPLKHRWGGHGSSYWLESWEFNSPVDVGHATRPANNSSWRYHESWQKRDAFPRWIKLRTTRSLPEHVRSHRSRLARWHDSGTDPIGS